MSLLAPPSQPHNLTVVTISDSWVTVQWQVPDYTGSQGISNYNVTVNTLGKQMEIISEMNRLSSEAEENITNLHPNSVIQVQVTAVSRVGDVVAVSPPSQPLLVNISARNQYLQGMHYTSST